MRRSGRFLRGVILTACAGCLAAAGCSQAAYDPATMPALRERALECLRSGLRYEHLAIVRVQSIEAIQNTVGADELPRLRLALHDEVPAVRFAAGLALGTLRDKVAEPSLRRLLDSAVASDRLVGIFALHRLGDARHTAELASALLEDEDPMVRRNAAMLLGRLGEKGALKLLTRAMRDSDRGLRANLLEAMALLGSKEAIATVYAQVYSGIGEEEAFALMVLGQLKNPLYRDMFVQKLESAMHIETKLAAARALGAIGDDSGFDVAMKGLRFTESSDHGNDPANNRTFRVRQMGALALGAIGDSRAIAGLGKMMNEEGRPRLQIAASMAILEILGGDRAKSLAVGGS